MSDVDERIARLSPAQQALLAQLRGAPVPAGPEPIAIVGMAVRVPGATDVPAFWRLLCAGGCAIGDVPADRWDADAYHDPDPAAPGKTTCRRGGFLPTVDDFDPAFFRMSRREAVRVDPQQRLLLEVAWEALDDAGVVRGALAGRRAGVFVGVMSSDHGVRLWSDPRRIDEYAGTGSAASMAASRISYMFDLRGPSVAVGTACSSSLVAVHQACASLWADECELALAGGVNLMLSPAGAISLTKSGVLAADGVCRPFDADAAGMVRGEGAGMVVLKKLSRARADGDPIWALVRGTAVNQNGRGNGLTAPSQEAQEDLLRLACARAGVRPADVAYVEAFAAGTPIGDVLELAALARVLGGARPAVRPCRLGAVKANLGHLEAASGVVGLIKAALVLHHATLVPTPHHVRPTPRFDWSAAPLRVQTALAPWPTDTPRLAGVSAFAFGGTNAHAILAAAPADAILAAADAQPANGAPWHLLPISAHATAALDEWIAAWQAFLADAPDPAPAGRALLADVPAAPTGPTGERRRLDEQAPRHGRLRDAELADVCFTAAARRTHHRLRVAVAGRSAAELAAGLARVAAGEPAALPVDLPDGLRAAAGRWLAGEPLDLAATHPHGGRCVRLPTYRYARERCRLDDPPATAPAELRRDWLYALAWRPRPAAVPEGRPARVQVVHHAAALAPALVDELRRRGRDVRAHDLAAGDPGDALPAWLGAPGPPPVLVHIAAADPTRAAVTAVGLVQTVDRAALAGPATLVQVTTGARAVLADDEVDPSAATVWGLGQVVPFEHPHLRSVRVDLDPRAPVEAAARALADELDGPLAEEQVAVRGRARHVPRLVRAGVDAPPAAPPRLHPHATYLVVGGLGHLGRHLAAWLVDRGARRLVLVTRADDPAAARPVVDALQARGAEVRVAIADVADRPALAAALAGLPRGWTPIRGVVHAAAIHDDAPLVALTPARLRAALAPRVAGLDHLAALVDPAALEFLIVCAASVGLLGAPEGGVAAAGDTHVDAAVHALRRRGVPALAVEFAPWSEGDGAADEQRHADLLVRRLPARAALALLEDLIARRVGHAAILPYDLPDLLRFYPRAAAAVFSELLPAPAAQAPAPARRPDLAHEFVPPRTPSEQRIAQLWREALDVERVGLHDGFFELGGDSVLAAQVTARVNAAFATDLALDVAFSAFTVEKLAAVVEERVLRDVESLSDEDAACLADDDGPRHG